jgi:hypothetical protein
MMVLTCRYTPVRDRVGPHFGEYSARWQSAWPPATAGKAPLTPLIDHEGRYWEGAIPKIHVTPNRSVSIP